MSVSVRLALRMRVIFVASVSSSFSIWGSSVAIFCMSFVLFITSARSRSRVDCDIEACIRRARGAEGIGARTKTAHKRV